MEGTILESLKVIAEGVALGGIPVGVGIYVFVQALKYAKLITTSDQARLANIIVAIVLGLLYASLEIFPQAKPVATTFFVALVGSIGAAIVYNKVSDTQDSGQAHPEG